MPELDFQRPLDIGCGAIVPIRTTSLCAVFGYSYDRERAPSGAQDKIFEFDLITVTTFGRWQFHGCDGATEIDPEHLMVGTYGDEYGCRHDRRCGDANLVFGLRPHALDRDEQPLFERQIVPSRGLPALIGAALRAAGDEAFDSLTFELFGAASSRSLRNGTGRVSRLRVQRAKRFIELHAFEPLRLSDVARTVGLSPFTFHRQFRAATGATPHAYLSGIRLERAKRLLARTSLPLQKVAAGCGFDDVAYFSRFIKKCTGLPPGQLRQRALRSQP